MFGEGDRGGIIRAHSEKPLSEWAWNPSLGHAYGTEQATTRRNAASHLANKYMFEGEIRPRAAVS